MKNIIFDWSGTLSDDFTPTYETIMILMKEYGGPHMTTDEFRQEFTLPYMNFWKKYFPDIDKAYHDKRFNAVFRTVLQPKMYAGVFDVLRYLSKKGLRMIIISSHPHEKLIAETKEYGVNDFFDDINGSIHNKAEAIKAILSKNRFLSSDTVFVGDMTHDVEAGKVAEVKTIAITWGYESRAKLLKASPDYIVKDILELKSIF